MSIISNMVHKKTSGSPLTALCFFFDGKFDNQLAELGVNLIGVKDLSVYDWTDSMKSNNLTLITENQISSHSYDLVIFNDLIAQSRFLVKYPGMLHIPSIIVNHEYFRETQYHLETRLRDSGCSEYIEVGFETQGKIINPGVESISNIKKDKKIILEGTFGKSNQDQLNFIKKELPDLELIGKNDLPYNISPIGFKPYREYLARCKVYLHLENRKGIDYSMLWAMANGAEVITLKDKYTSKIIDGSNGFLCNSLDEMIHIAKKRVETPYNGVSSKAQEITKRFPFKDFKNNWLELLNQYKNKVYIR